MSAAGAELRALLRQYLRLARDFPNYNIKHYLHRRATEEARRVASLTDTEAVQAAVQRAKDDLAVWRRQSIVYGLYGRKIKNVLEVDAAHAKP